MTGTRWMPPLHIAILLLARHATVFITAICAKRCKWPLERSPPVGASGALAADRKSQKVGKIGPPAAVEPLLRRTATLYALVRRLALEHERGMERQKAEDPYVVDGGQNVDTSGEGVTLEPPKDERQSSRRATFDTAVHVHCGGIDPERDGCDRKEQKAEEGAVIISANAIEHEWAVVIELGDTVATILAVLSSQRAADQAR